MDQPILNPRNPLERIESLKANGYTHDFIYGKDGLCTANKDKEYSQEEVTIDDEFRYEGMSNPGDMSIIYAITTADNTKGYCLVSYAPKIHEPVHDFFKAVEVKQG